MTTGTPETSTFTQQELDQFLADTRHDLRAPLSAILGFSELLAEENAGPLNDKQKRFLANIQDGARHLQQLIDRLDGSKMEKRAASRE